MHDQSDTWLRLGRLEGEYSEIYSPGSLMKWPERLRSMLGWIKEVGPSVICLQEVDYQLFESDLLPALQSLGYSGLSQRPKKMCKNQPCGCATFWRHDRFKLNKQCIKSRAMAVHLRDRTHQSQEVVVVNVHLEASQSAASARNRARQINSPLRWAAEQATGVPVLVAGDFNTGGDSPLLHVLRNECWHGHDLAAAYEHPAASDTLPVCNASMACHDVRLLIDHIFYSHSQFELDSILEVCQSLTAPLAIHRHQPTSNASTRAAIR